MTFYRPVYTSLDRVRKILALGTDAVDDTLLQRYVLQMSAWFSTRCMRQFVPYYDTRTYDTIGQHILHRRCYLDEDLLEVTSLTVNGEAYTLGTDYRLQPSNVDPKSYMELISTSGKTWQQTATTYEDKIVVVGTWGYHDQYSAAWIDTLDTVEDNPLSSTATTITVNDVDGFDVEGQQRFEIDMYLRIEDEYLQITDMDTIANTLTVRRGIQGTTAAAHNQNTAIDSYRQVQDIQFAVEKMAVWAYQHRDSIQDIVQVLNTGVTVRSDAVAYAREIANTYQRIVLGAAR